MSHHKILALKCLVTEECCIFYLQIMDEVKAGIKYAFQTENQWTVCVSGTGNLSPTHIASYHNDVGSESDITPCINRKTTSGLQILVYVTSRIQLDGLTSKRVYTICFMSYNN